MPVWLKSVIGAVLVAALTAFGQQLAAGAVPLPPAWAWVVPVVTAVIAVLTPHIKGEDQPPHTGP